MFILVLAYVTLISVSAVIGLDILLSIHSFYNIFIFFSEVCIGSLNK